MHKAQLGSALHTVEADDAPFLGAIKELETNSFVPRMVEENVVNIKAVPKALSGGLIYVQATVVVNDALWKGVPSRLSLPLSFV